MNNYKIIKLTSGESLICKISKIKTDTVLIERPMVFKSIQLPNNPLFFGAEALQLKNWMEFSEDKTVEIPINHITALMKADPMISHCYDMEKEKEDTPNAKNQEMKDILSHLQNLPPVFPQDNKPQNGIPQKLNINFNVPEDMISDVMGALGININGDEEFIADEGEFEEPPPPPANKNKSDNWGNDWQDWPADPHDYI
jgi:hypothetical protein